MEPSLPAVFGAGVLSFASPCVLPMVPIYLATLAGGGVAALSTDAPRARLILRATAFAIGLAVPFIILGMGASSAGRLLIAHRTGLSLGAAALVMAFGVKQLGLVRIPWLDVDARPALDRVNTDRGLLGALLFGAAFGLGWTPCVGPVLGAVLTWTAQSGASPARGALTLATYAAGLSMPLIIAGAFAPSALRLVRRFSRRAVWAERISGIALVASGLWLITQQAPVSVATPAVAQTAQAAPCANEAAVGCGLPSVAPAAAAHAVSHQGVVEFMRRDCPACAAMAPVVREAETHCGVSVRRVIVDDAEGMAEARSVGVLGVPTFVAFDPQGHEVTRFVGVQPRASLETVMSDLSGRPCGS